MTENSLFDKKSLRAVIGKTADFRELAKDCIAFANAQGGHIHIGIEDNSTLPPQNQKISKKLLVDIDKKINENTQNVFVHSQKIIAKNSGEYIDLSVFPSNNSIASTSDGKYFLRIGDASKSLLPDELTRLFNDRPSFIWETKRTNVRIDKADSLKKSNFIADIKNSNRVSDFLKEKTDNEIYENYQMSDTDGFLTNLGVLWLGTQQQRARLCYSPVIQVIKYDEKGQKINKWVYDDYSLNPKEILEKIMQDIPDWKEIYEVEDGLFRKTIPAYDNVVIRELLVNALAHRPYTTRGDVFINLFPSYMTIRNPGLLPLGVTPKNILNKSVQRNEHLSKIFNVLGLMEKEGSGYDIIFEKLLFAAKPVPEIAEDDDSVCVKIQKDYINKDLVQFMDKISMFYNLTQKEKICIGLIVQNGEINALDLAERLSAKNDDGLRSWTKDLIDKKLVQVSGKTRGAVYRVTKETFENVKFQTKTTLKAIEPYRIKELIYEDLKRYKTATFDEIRTRIGREISHKEIRRQLAVLIKENRVKKNGENRWTKYEFI